MTPNHSNDNAQVSEVRAFTGGGSPSAFLASGLNVNSLRTNAILRHEDWLEIDRAVVDVARQTLVGISDLRQYGLVQPLGGLGTLLSGYEQMGDMTDANVDMSGITPGEEDRDTFSLVSVPIPIIHKDFRLNIRTLEASRRLGDGLDVTQAQVASRKVSEMAEQILFNGSTIKVNTNAIYGYCTHPSRNTGSAIGDFGTISNIYPTIQAMVNALMQDGYYGPYGLYVSPNQYSEMTSVYSDGSGHSAIQRVLTNLPQVKYIKPAYKLADGNLVMPQLSRDVVDLAVAQDIVNVQWSENGNFTTLFKVMAAMAPRIKADAEGHSGIAHFTGG